MATARRQDIIRKRRRVNRAFSRRSTIARRTPKARARAKQQKVAPVSTEAAVNLGVVSKRGNVESFELVPSEKNFKLYLKDLVKFTTLTIKAIEPKALAFYERELGQIEDAPFNVDQLPFTLAKMKASVDRMTTRENVFNRQQFLEKMDQAIGIDLSRVLKDEGIEAEITAATKDNLRLIKSIPEVYQDRLNKIMLQGLAKGTPIPNIRKQIFELGQVSYRRARIIARDQITKLTSQLSKVRYQEAGIDGYIWKTSQDERVRDTHEENDGRFFKWTDKLKTGHPGEAVLCRCLARPDFNTVAVLRNR